MEGTIRNGQVFVNLYRMSIERLKELEENAELLEELMESEDNTNLDIDKSWDGVHYLLTGRRFDGKTELANVILGGEILGGEENADEFDVGYGPPMYILEDEVKSIAKILEKSDLAEIKKRFEPTKFAKLNIYPFDDNDISRVTEQDLDYFMSYLKDVINFYQVASVNNEVIVKTLS